MLELEYAHSSQYSAGDWTVSQKVQDPALLLTPTINLKRSLTKNFKIEAEKCYHDRHVLASMTAKVRRCNAAHT